MTQKDLESVASLAGHPKVMAIGEIGLDYHYDDACPREIQREVFAQQLALAKELSLPVIVHDREAHGDTLDLLRKYRPEGIVHCYSGSPEMVEEIVKLGMYIGFTGVVTFKNASKTLRAAAAVPLGPGCWLKPTPPIWRRSPAGAGGATLPCSNIPLAHWQRSRRWIPSSWRTLPLQTPAGSTIFRTVKTEIKAPYRAEAICPMGSFVV